MKLRFLFGFLAILAGLVIGFGAHPAHAAAATSITLTATDRADLQSVLNVTHVALDALQKQVDQNPAAIKDPAAVVSTLSSIKGVLLAVRGILDASVPAPTQVPTPAPTAAPQVQGASTESTPQTASVGSSGAAAKWAFWIILAVAIVTALVLVLMPRKKVAPLPHAPSPQASPAPQPTLKDEPQTIQSA